MLTKENQEKVLVLFLNTIGLLMFGANEKNVKGIRAGIDELFDGETRTEMEKCCGLWDFDKK